MIHGYLKHVELYCDANFRSLKISQNCLCILEKLDTILCSNLVKTAKKEQLPDQERQYMI